MPTLSVPQLPSTMPSVSNHSLADDQVDDILYLTRTGQFADLQTLLGTLTQTTKSARIDIIRAAVDQQTGNTPLHMACANGHIGVSSYPVDHKPAPRC